MPAPRNPAAKPPIKPGRLNKPPSEPAGYAGCGARGEIPSCSAASASWFSSIMRAPPAKRASPTSRASASSAHSNSPNVRKRNATSGRSHLTRGTIPIRVAAHPCTATPFRLHRAQHQLLQPRRVIEAFYAAGAQPDLSQSVARAHAAGCVSLEHRRSSHQSFLHGVDQLLERKGLWQKCGLFAISWHVLLECVLGVAGNENDLQARIATAQFSQQRRSVHFRHDHVGDNQIYFAIRFLQHFDSLDTVAGFENGVAARSEPARVELTQALLILDQKDCALSSEVDAVR